MNASQRDIRDPEEEDGKHYCRKDKSLGELCKRFLSLYGRDHCCTINLNFCIQQLEVERRRIYDIINILEGLSVVSKKCKNVYEWKGFTKLREEIINFETAGKLKQEAKISSTLCQEGVGSKCEKSLGFLCTHFINFIIQSGTEISLVECANDFIKLYQQDEGIGRASSIIRRLYDIANVLSSLGLLEKLSQSTQKKPVFKWLGEKGLRKVCPSDSPKSKVFNIIRVPQPNKNECMKVVQRLIEEGKSNMLCLLSLRAIMCHKKFYVKSSGHCSPPETPMICKRINEESTAEKSPFSPLKKKCLEFTSIFKDITNVSCCSN